MFGEAFHHTIKFGFVARRHLFLSLHFYLQLFLLETKVKYMQNGTMWSYLI